MLESERLKFVPLTVKFATERYLSWLNDPEIQIHLMSAVGRKQTMDDLLQYIEGLSINDRNFAVLFLGEHVGNIKVHSIDYVNLRSEIGYLIGEKTLWGKGIGSEAVRRITDYCFVELGMHKVTAGCDVRNVGSVKVLEKNGFQLEGTLRHHFKVGSQFIDVYRYGKIKL